MSVSNEKDLGVIVSQDLKQEKQCGAVVCVAHVLLGSIVLLMDMGVDVAGGHECVKRYSPCTSGMNCLERHFQLYHNSVI